MADKVGGVEFEVDINTSGAVAAGSKLVQNNEKIEDSFQDVDLAAKKSSDTMVKGSTKASKAVGGMSRNVGMAGVQIGQFAGQIQGGQNALLAFSQQGADIGMLFGPSGMIAGGILAIGSALAGSLIPGLMDSTDAMGDLESAMDQLRKTAKRGESGLFDFTESIKGLSKIGASVVAAELEAGLIRAEMAAKAAAKGITEELSKLDVDYGFSGIDDYVRALNNASKSTAVNIEGSKGWIEITTELGEQFGKTGAEARTAGALIIESLAALEKTPSADKFEALQKKLSELSLSGDGVSEAAKLMISDLKLFFAEARSAAETADFLSSQLKKLNESGGVDLDISGTGEQLSVIGELTKTLTQELQLAELKLEGSTVQAMMLSAAFSAGLDNASQLPIETQELIKKLHEATQAQKDKNAAEVQAIRDKTAAEREAAAERAKLASQFESVESKGDGTETELEKIKAKFEAERQIVKEHADILLQSKKDGNLLTEEEEKRHKDALDAINSRQKKAEEKVEKDKKKAKLSAVSSTFNSLSSLMNTESKKLFKIGKASAIAAAIVDGYAAVQKTMASVAYPYNIPLAAAQAAASAVQVQNIAKTKFGGSQSMDSTVGFSGGAPAVNTAQTPNQNISISGINADSLISGGQLVDTLNQALGDGYTINFSGG